MSVQLIPFGQEGQNPNLPAHLQQAPDRNTDLESGGVGFPVLSIKGKVFTISRSGEREILTRPDDKASPLSAIPVVLIRAQTGVSKVFYKEQYEEGKSDGKEPDCYSNDGTAPAPDVVSPQSTTCATCPNNQWGSVITPSGKKGKACSDVKRVAVAAASDPEDVMLLRVPPASLKALTLYSKLLQRHGINDYAAVVTRVGFEMSEATPKLTFTPEGILGEADYAKVSAMYDDPVTQEIVGLSSSAPIVPPEGVEETPAGLQQAATLGGTAAETTAEPTVDPAQAAADAAAKAAQDAADKAAKAAKDAADAAAKQAQEAAAKAAQATQATATSAVQEAAPTENAAVTEDAKAQGAVVTSGSSLESELEDLLGDDALI